MSFNWIGRSADGNTVTLRKLCPEMLMSITKPDLLSSLHSVGTGAVIDIETTGLDQNRDKIIEVGVQLFRYCALTGFPISLDSSYSGLEDPGEPLSEKVKLLTGINDQMLRGHKIDWSEINTMLSQCNIIIAHNASFDRPFIDKKVDVSKNKLWGCSLKQVDWEYHGFTSAKLELLNIYHGFFTDSHRALNDAEALIYLLSLQSNKHSTLYMPELMRNAAKKLIVVKARYASFDKKDYLKARGYRWNGEQKIWSVEIRDENRDAEVKWLTEVIYQGECRAEIHSIDIVDHFKN